MYHRLRWWSEFLLHTSFFIFGVILLTEATISNWIHVGAFFISYGALNLIFCCAIAWGSYWLHCSEECDVKTERGSYMQYMYCNSVNYISQGRYWFMYMTVFVTTVFLFAFFLGWYGFHPLNNFVVVGTQTLRWLALVLAGGLIHIWTSLVGFRNLMIWSNITFGDIYYMVGVNLEVKAQV